MGILDGFDMEDALNEIDKDWAYFLDKEDYNTAIVLWLRKVNNANLSGQSIYTKKDAFLAFARYFGYDK